MKKLLIEKCCMKTENRWWNFIQPKHGAERQSGVSDDS